MLGSLIMLLQIINLMCVLGLALYGIHTFWLTWQYRRFQNKEHSKQVDVPHVWPRVTIQLPIYNERHVVERLIDACATMSYPLEKVQIQVLDDSDDSTTAIIEHKAAAWRRCGRNVVVVHRSNRNGFKGGALANALAQATGEFIAIFDADFEPSPNFLVDTLPHFLESGNERIGFVQVRWDHLNPNYSALTRCQAIALDGHFVVEQAGRSRAGYAFGFNGSAGIWRRACIEDPAVGGWQIDTLCEDLDLSYRAQLAAWRGLYLDQVAAPAEIPPQLLAFKRQQSRWAKGSVQTLRKLSTRVWQSNWSLEKRLAGLLHLGSYLLHPFLLLLLLASLPMILLGVNPVAPLAYLRIGFVRALLYYTLWHNTIFIQKTGSHDGRICLYSCC